MDRAQQELWKTALQGLQEMKVINEYVMQEVTETGKSRHYLAKNEELSKAIDWLLKVRLNIVRDMLDDLRVHLSFVAEAGETEGERTVGRKAVQMVDEWGLRYEAQVEVQTQYVLENTVEFYEEIVERIREEKEEREGK